MMKWWVWLDDEDGRYETAEEVDADVPRAAAEYWAEDDDRVFGLSDRVEIRVSDHAPTHDDDGTPWKVVRQVAFHANPDSKRR
jgi:hypothetical protein